MSAIRVITLRLDQQDPEEAMLIALYDDAASYRKSDFLRSLLKDGMRARVSRVSGVICDQKQIQQKNTVSRASPAKPQVKEVLPVRVVEKPQPPIITSKPSSGLPDLFGNQSF